MDSQKTTSFGDHMNIIMANAVPILEWEREGTFFFILYLKYV
jgi:hypothetical protein